MNTDALKDAIAKATATQWPGFAAEHPALARVIDESLLNDSIASSLADDPDFTAAYQAAVDANVGPQALATLVDGFVTPALQRLL